MNLGEYEDAARLATETLQVCRQNHDRHGEGVALYFNGLVARVRGDIAASLAYYEQSAALLRERGEVWYLTHALSGMGLAAMQRASSRRRGPTSRRY